MMNTKSREQKTEAEEAAAAASSSILEEDTSRSLAATLKLAAAKGYIEKKESKKQPTVVISGAKKTKLEAKSYTIEEKREDHNNKHRGHHHNQHHRSRGNHLREVREPEDYRPEINLEYTDDAGRKLDRKEAWRHLCYKFHGRGPGKNKIDKRLKKQELKSKIQSAMSTDVPNSAALMISKQKELETPFIVLSKGK